MTASCIAVDIGMTNIDLVVEDFGGVSMQMLRNHDENAENQVRGVLKTVRQALPVGMTLCVTSGCYRDLPDEMDKFQILKVDEMRAVGLGGCRQTPTPSTWANSSRGLIL